MSRIGWRGLAALAGIMALLLASAAMALRSAATTPSIARVATTVPPTASQNPMLTLSGHGLGDGVGMGQWGALGYALNGYSYSFILNHYYGGTTMAKVPDQLLRVVLTANDTHDAVVSATTAFSVGGHAFAAGTAARMHLEPSGDFALTSGTSCSATTWRPVATLTPETALAVPAGPSIELCLPGQNTSYRGDIQAASYQGAARTLNVVSLEDYLQSVVPAESPAYWGTLGRPGAQGRPEGFQELEAQAVAARSYVMSDLGQYGFADICDTSACQSYPGMADESPITDQAVADTAGEVLDLANGSVASTQYSASTGGYTAGGPFPAVSDPGDSICVASACNPNHNWSAQIPLSGIDSAYPSIGTLESVRVTSRNGLGAFGGRVDTLTLQGTSGALTVTGDDFAAAFGLDSNWFSVTSVGSALALAGVRVVDSAGDVADLGAGAYHGSLGGTRLGTPLVAAAGTPDGGGYWLLEAAGQLSAFGDARSYGSPPYPGRRFVALAPTPDGKGYWLATSAGGVYAYGDASWHGSLGAAGSLPSPIAGIAATPDGGGYWLVSAAGEVYSFGDAHLWGPAPPLHAPVVAIASTPDGGGYWLLQSDGGVLSFGDAHYFGNLLRKSPVRATALVPTPDGGGYLIGTAAGPIYGFGDAPTLGSVTTSATFHPPAVGLVGVLAAKR